MKSHEKRVVLRRGRGVAVEVMETGRHRVARKVLPAKYKTVERATRNRKAATAGLALPPSLMNDNLGQNVFPKGPFNGPYCAQSSEPAPAHAPTALFSRKGIMLRHTFVVAGSHAKGKLRKVVEIINKAISHL